MSIIEARKVAKKYLSKLLSETEAKLKVQKQNQLTLKEHEDLLRYQKLCEEQRQLIETLQKQLAEKIEEAEEWRLKLWGLCRELTPSYQAEQRKLQQQKDYEHKMRDRPKPAAQIPPEDYDFWHTTVEEQEGEGREVKFDDIAKSKGLWIVSMEENTLGIEPKKEKSATVSPFNTTVKSKASVTSTVFQPAQSTKKLIVREPPQKKDNFEAQRAKHQATLGERMPMGRDGKRLPMPKPQPRRANAEKSSENMRRSGLLPRIT